MSIKAGKPTQHSRRLSPIFRSRGMTEVQVLVKSLGCVEFVDCAGVGDAL